MQTIKIQRKNITYYINPEKNIIVAKIPYALILNPIMDSLIQKKCIAISVTDGHDKFFSARPELDPTSDFVVKTRLHPVDGDLNACETKKELAELFEENIKVANAKLFKRYYKIQLDLINCIIAENQKFAIHMNDTLDKLSSNAASQKDKFEERFKSYC